jgi:hypothetical protein
MSAPEVPIQHRRAVQALRSGGPATPPGLRRALPPPRPTRARLLRPAIALAAAAALVRDVVANHDALVLGLPGERRNRRR